MGCITTPFRHVILDAPPPAYEWPADDSPAWVAYDSPLERKRTLNDWRAMPPPLREALATLLLLPAGEALGLRGPLVPDLGLWGAGCHEMRAGDHLDLHLDASCHALTGLSRRANAILFLSHWLPEWGGQLELWELGGTRPAVSIDPRPGRLVLFETGDGTPHRVAPLTCPAGARRQSLCLFWFGIPPRGVTARPRAQFLPLPGEHDAAKDTLRRERARP